LPLVRARASLARSGRVARGAWRVVLSMVVGAGMCARVRALSAAVRGACEEVFAGLGVGCVVMTLEVVL
jgi:hypothetical protein